MKLDHPKAKLFVFVVLLSFSEVGFGHVLDPAVLVIEESQPGFATVAWQGSENFVKQARWRFEPECLATTYHYRRHLKNWRGQLLLRCASLAGAVFANIAGPMPSQIILRYTYFGEQERTLVLGSRVESIQLPPRQAGYLNLFARFMSFGFEHFVLAYDHALFVACLYMLLGFTRKLWLALLCFTLGHSFTLLLMQIKNLPYSEPLIELCIALSLLVLGRECLQKKIGTSIICRFPGSTSALWGLFHGMGFATVLGEQEISSSNLLFSVLSFNLGLELGQLVFILFLFSMLTLVRKVTPMVSWGVVREGIYLISWRDFFLWSILTLSAFWYWERLFRL